MVRKKQKRYATREIGAMEMAHRRMEIAEMYLFGDEKKEEKEMTKAMFMQGTEMAVVTLNAEGRVEISREGMGVAVMATGVNFDTVVKKFENTGWALVPEAAPQTQNTQPTLEEEKTMDVQKAMESAAAQNITLAMQQEVDAYLELHEQIAELNKKLEAGKKSIRSYMDTNNLTAIKGTKGKQVYLQDAKASNSTSNFSDYDLADIMMAIPDKELLNQVTELRVNTKKLESVLALDKLPTEKVEQIKKLKISLAGTPRFSVKK